MTTVLQASGGRPIVYSLRAPTWHVRRRNAGGLGECLESLPRCLVITFAGQCGAACIHSLLVRRAAPSERPIIQQLKRRPDASNIVGDSESNDDRYWPGELSAVHDNLQVAIPRMVASSVQGALGNLRVGLGAGAFIQMQDYVCRLGTQPGISGSIRMPASFAAAMNACRA
jgi:hypothetical protein